VLAASRELAGSGAGWGWPPLSILSPPVPLGDLMYTALNSLVGDTLDMAGTLLGTMAPLYALPLGLAALFAIGFWLKSLLGGGD